MADKCKSATLKKMLDKFNLIIHNNNHERKTKIAKNNKRKH